MVVPSFGSAVPHRSSRPIFSELDVTSEVASALLVFHLGFRFSALSATAERPSRPVIRHRAWQWQAFIKGQEIHLRPRQRAGMDSTEYKDPDQGTIRTHGMVNWDGSRVGWKP